MLLDSPSPVFGGLVPEHRALLAEGAREVSYVKRQRLFAEHRTATGCWLIRRGHIAIDVLVLGRGPVTIQTLGPGDLVGWSWLLPPHEWQFGAVAVTDVDAVELDTNRILAHVAEDPAFGQAIAMAMFGMVTDRLRHTRARLLDVYGVHSGH